jgi:hypothetical protein
VKIHRTLALADAVTAPAADAGGAALADPRGTSCTLARPDGSGAGITALNAGQKDADGSYRIDFARSSRAPTWFATAAPPPPRP